MAALRGSTGDDEQDMEGREALVEASLADVIEAFNEALRASVKEPVVFLVDCTDEIGEAVARAWEGDDAVESALLSVADQQPEGADESAVTATLIRGFPFADARQDVPKLFPYLAGSFDQPPSDEWILVVVISYGGAATFHAPRRIH